MILPKTKLVFFSAFVLLSVNSAQADTGIDFSGFFSGYQGAFVILNTHNGNIQRHNNVQSIQQLSPCSTFKIAHSLFALDSGVIKDANHTLKWDGKKRKMNAWNSDLPLNKAIAVSAVPHFQLIAKKIGPEKMKAYLSKTNYGNQDISGGITRFWLGSTLKISAEEQVTFIKNMLQFKLPVSKHSIKTVKEILKLEVTEKGVLYGKTGSMANSYGNLSLGWFVGFVEYQNTTYIFATNIKGGDRPSGQRAKKITKDVLSHMNLL